MARLSVLVPRARLNLTWLQGVLAPAWADFAGLNRERKCQLALR
jgi:hypothetical protein